ncbi:MAG: hypothetical protein ACR2NA_13190 [Solirubrobacterales bacterium]
MSDRRPRAATADKAVERRRRTARDERPLAPWGEFPLSELLVLGGLTMLVIGFLAASPPILFLGLLFGSLGGLEVAAREHLAGYQSHTLLLSGAVAMLVLTGLVILIPGVGALGVRIAVAAVAFAAAAAGFRALFRRRSGGAGMRVRGFRA